MARRHREAHDLEGERRKRHAHQQFGHADAPALARHDAAVGATGEHAAAGDGMAVDRRHHGLGMKEHRVVELVQGRQEFPHIVGAAFAQALEIDAGGKYLALPGQHHRLGVGRAQFGRSARPAPRRIRCRAHWPCRAQRQHGDAGLGLDVDHAACPTACGMRRPRVRQPLGMHHRDGEHHDRQDLMRERQRERRLIEQRDDAERGLQRHRAGQYDRAALRRAACRHASTACSTASSQMPSASMR